MIIPHNNINQYQQTSVNGTPAFQGRNHSLKNLDDVCRRVIQEFPVVSNTKLHGYNKVSKYKQYLFYTCDVMSDYRKYYKKSSNPKKMMYKELAGMKQLRIGNCAELADATLIALKLNGIDDTKLLHLYAYNKKTGKLRNLDHSLVGVNFKLPKGYKYHKWLPSENHIEPETRIYPQRNSIIVDAWLGFSEYASVAGEKYKSNRTLIQMNKSGKRECFNTLLDKNEELCYVPLESYAKFKKRDYDYFGQTYPHIVLKKNVNNVGKKDVRGKRAYKIKLPYPLMKAEAKNRYSLKGAISDEELKAKHKAYQNYIDKKYGLNKEYNSAGVFDILLYLFRGMR